MATRDRARTALRWGSDQNYVAHASGAHITYMDGSKYLRLDVPSNLLGFNNPLMRRAMEPYFVLPSLDCPHELEIEAAQALKECFPWVRQWCFVPAHLVDPVHYDLSAFRDPLLSATRRRNEVPDCYIVPPVCANGQPVCAVGFAEGDAKAYRQASPVHPSYLAAIKALSHAVRHNSTYNPALLTDAADEFFALLNRFAAPKGFTCSPLGCSSVQSVIGDYPAYQEFRQRAREAGILCDNSLFPTLSVGYAHIPHLPGLISSCRDILAQMPDFKG